MLTLLHYDAFVNMSTAPLRVALLGKGVFEEKVHCKRGMLGIILFDGKRVNKPRCR